MTLSEHEALLELQGHKCAVCSKQLTIAFSDFVNGKVKALLCLLCRNTVKHLRFYKKRGVPIYDAAAYVNRAGEF